MCWFIIDLKTGRYGEHVKEPSRRGNELYLHNLAFDSFFDAGYAFHEFLAPYSRPSFEDIMAFIVDGEIRDSFHDLPQTDLAEYQKTMRDFWAAWDSGEDGYQALLGRPMLREEKYWLVQPWVHRMSVDRKQFYKEKTVVREEWYFRWHWGPEREWQDGCYARLRIFSDDTTDTWRPGIGLRGYDDEENARRELIGARYYLWEEIENQLFDGRFLPEPPPPSELAFDDTSEPFRYEGTS